MTIRPRRCQSRWCDIRIFNPHPHKGATSGAYLVNSRTAVVNPTAKACFCQSSHSCNRASRASLLTADVSVSNCLCSDSGSNKSGSRLHSPSYRASNSGFSFSPLDFSRIVCYHRFRSVSALRWVVSATSTKQPHLQPYFLSKYSEQIRRTIEASEMFFFAASFFRASYSADEILIFNALSFTFSPPLQFYYNYCYMSTVIFHNLPLLFLLVLPSLAKQKIVL